MEVCIFGSGHYIRIFISQLCGISEYITQFRPKSVTGYVCLYCRGLDMCTQCTLKVICLRECKQKQQIIKVNLAEIITDQKLFRLVFFLNFDHHSLQNYCRNYDSVGNFVIIILLIVFTFVLLITPGD